MHIEEKLGTLAEEYHVASRNAGGLRHLARIIHRVGP
jgi:hypothetical protein